MLGNGHVRFGGRGWEDRRPRGRTASRLRPYTCPRPGGRQLPVPAGLQRYTKGSIILTSNRGLASWGAGLRDDSVVAAAMLDRLLHRATVVSIDGECTGCGPTGPTSTRSARPSTPERRETSSPSDRAPLQRPERLGKARPRPLTPTHRRRHRLPFRTSPPGDSPGQFRPANSGQFHPALSAPYEEGNCC